MAPEFSIKRWRSESLIVFNGGNKVSNRVKLSISKLSDDKATMLIDFVNALCKDETKQEQTN